MGRKVEVRRVKASRPGAACGDEHVVKHGGAVGVDPLPQAELEHGICMVCGRQWFPII